MEALKAELESLLRTQTRTNPTIVSAIQNRAGLEFVYNGKARIVEPQTYGITNTGKEVLRTHQRSGRGRIGETGVAKLFDVAKITKLKKSGQKFAAALPAHNPDDSAMIEIFATLPKPDEKRSLRSKTRT